MTCEYNMLFGWYQGWKTNLGGSIMFKKSLMQKLTTEEWQSMDDDAQSEMLDTRTKLLSGQAYALAVPNRRHQRILGQMFTQFSVFLQGKACEIYPTPFSVRLDATKDTTFEPDITVICDRDKLTDAGCEGAPDLLIEILSPSTSRWDKCVKFEEYLKAGVREYWIVDPVDQLVAVHILNAGEYSTKVYGNEGAVPVHVLPGFSVDMAPVFEEI